MNISSQDESSKIRDSVFMLQNELEEKETDCQKLLASNASLKSSLQNVNGPLKLNKSKIANLQNDYDVLLQSFSTVQNQIMELEKMRDKLLNDISQGDKIRDTLVSVKKHLEHQLRSRIRSLQNRP